MKSRGQRAGVVGGSQFLFSGGKNFFFEGAPGRLLQGSLLRLVSLWWELPPRLKSNISHPRANAREKF
jgi:hypothetical protein